MTSLRDLIKKNRSYRRFFENKKIKRKELEEFVDLARLSPSGGNIQPLRFYLSNEKEENSRIFETLSWAGYIKDWEGPEEGERPSAYIIILADKNSPKPVEYDAAIAAQSILLGAVENGFGGCIIGSVKRARLQEHFNFPENLKISLVIALGIPKERVVIEDVKDNDIHYWRDEDKIHHVPKYKLSELIIN